MLCAQVWRCTHLKLQHRSIKNLNGASILMWHFIDHKVCFLSVVCTLWGTLGGTLWYLLWIRRETHGGKLIGLVVFNTPCIKLRVTCVYILLLVPIILSFQSRSLKTVVLIIGHWSILSAHGSCLEGLILNWLRGLCWRVYNDYNSPRMKFNFLRCGGRNNHCIWHGLHKISYHPCPCLSLW
jgi:hypothetical protein